MADDAIALLKNDHREVRALFEQFEALTPRAVKKAEQVRDRIVKALSVHAAIEERVLYPVMIELVPDAEADVLEGLQEHALAEQLLAQVAGMNVEDRWFHPKMKVLMESVEHHIKEEEKDLFPQLRKALTKSDLLNLADELRVARKSAPVVPPPAAQVRGLLENVQDRTAAFLHQVAGSALAGAVKG